LSVIEIQIENLHKSFDGKQILKGINLDIYQGDVIAVVGGSGCGKTVLLNHILGQIAPDQGHVRVIDHDDPAEPLRDLTDLDGLELDSIHQHWGVVFQRNALFSGSVYENIALWLKEVKGLHDDTILPIAKKYLKAVALPNDEQFLNRPHEKLSGGMAKRLAIARALSMSPVVVFYDEPTTGLDPTSSAQIHNLIYDTHFELDKRTTIIITHDKDLLSRLQPRIIMLHEGNILFDGPFADFKDSESEVIRPYFDLMPILHKRNILDK
jgi:phospholipid/cholesterol/gamma-HCH transport system ATP-binding protein